MDRIQQLRNKLKTAQDDCTERVDILNDLLVEVLVIDIQEAEQIAAESAELSRKLSYKEGLCRIPFNKGAILYNKDELEKAKEFLIAALRESESCSFEKGQGYAMFLLGLIDWSFGEIERGFEYLQKSLQLARKVQEPFMVAWSHTVLGGFYYDLGDYKNSLEHFEKARALFNEIKSTEGAARALNGIGNNHLLMGYPEKALEFQEQCLKTLRSTKIAQVEARVLHDLANIYKELGKHDAAVGHFKKSLAMRRSIGQMAGEVSTLLQLGDLFFEMNEVEESKGLLDDALAKAVKINARPKICRAHNSLAKIYNALGQPDQALKHYMRFHELEKEIYHDEADKKLKHLQVLHQMEQSTREAEIYRLRNVDLKNTNRQLKKLLKELKAAQTQLIHSEKMATLGKLVAGLAHEINNPVGAIRATNQVIEQCIGKIDQAVDASAAKEELGDSEQYQKIMRILRQNTSLITDATARIAAIVKSLKSFVRLDEAALQKADVHDAIENVLNLIAHELSTGIRLIKEFGDIPQIYCFPGELNQVFMTLLNNAVQAVGREGQIGIKTFAKNGRVDVQISDSGPGIHRDRLKRIFEFDFSQSGSRMKMGMGLVTARSILQKHKGTIAVQSKIGCGSTFTISLPTDLKDKLDS